MKVDSYAVGMTSSSVSMKSYTVTEKLVVEQGGGANSGNQNSALLMLSPEGREQSASAAGNSGNAAVQGAKKPFEYSLSDKESMKIYMLHRFVESITGKKYDFSMFDKFRADNNYNLLAGKQIIQMPMVSLERTETYQEFQQMSFEAAGVVNTSDGRQIRFDLNVSASYEFSSSISVAVKGGRYGST
jgi:hypothetical protein